jgi:hypothetical protein
MHNTEHGAAADGGNLAWGSRVREFVVGMFRQLTVKGFLWSATVPLAVLLLFYGLVLHVWLRLGRWPHFGENFQNPVLQMHADAVLHVGGLIGISLMAAPVVALVCLFFRRWRQVWIYLVCYAIGVAILWGAVTLAPHEFLNWFLD